MACQYLYGIRLIKEPEIEERFDPDRTVLTLEFLKKTGEENKRQYCQNTGVSCAAWRSENSGYC